jgi:hypothetical protein
LQVDLFQSSAARAANEGSVMTTTRAHRVGDATVIKIPELALDAVEAGVLYPDQANDPIAAVEEARKRWPGSGGGTRGRVFSA